MTKKKPACINCGCELDRGWEICPVCSFSAVKAEETIPQENMPSPKTPENNTQNYSGNEKLFIFVFLLCLSVIIVTNASFNFSAEQISIIAFIVAGISIVTGFIKYPENKVINCLFYISLCVIIAFGLSMFLLVVACITSQ